MDFIQTRSEQNEEIACQEANKFVFYPHLGFKNCPDFRLNYLLPRFCVSYGEYDEMERMFGLLHDGCCILVFIFRYAKDRFLQKRVAKTKLDLDRTAT